MMSILTEIYGSNEYEDRHAKVALENGVYFVHMYKGDNLFELRSMNDHSEHYAQDCAENWVTGIIND